MRPNFGSAALNGVIAQHLRLVGAKQQTDSFLLRLKALQSRFQHGEQAPELSEPRRQILEKRSFVDQKPHAVWALHGGQP